MQGAGRGSSMLMRRGALLIATAAFAAATLLAAPGATHAQNAVGGLCKAPEAGRQATGCVPPPPPPGEHIS